MWYPVSSRLLHQIAYRSETNMKMVKKMWWAENAEVRCTELQHKCNLFGHFWLKGAILQTRQYIIVIIIIIVIMKNVK